MYITEIDLDLDLLVLPGDRGESTPRTWGRRSKLRSHCHPPEWDCWVDTLLGCPPRSPSRAGWWGGPPTLWKTRPVTANSEAPGSYAGGCRGVSGQVLPIQQTLVHALLQVKATLYHLQAALSVIGHCAWASRYLLDRLRSHTDLAAAWTSDCCLSSPNCHRSSPWNLLSVSSTPAPGCAPTTCGSQIWLCMKFSGGVFLFKILVSWLHVRAINSEPQKGHPCFLSFLDDSKMYAKWGTTSVVQIFST